jgi:hypothetical protein
MKSTRLWNLIYTACFFALCKAGTMAKRGSQCTLAPGGEGIDDSRAIIDAFDQCGQNGHVVFQNATYYIERVLNTTGLVNCTVDIQGTLLVSIPPHYRCLHLTWRSSGVQISSTG